jgi:hypothetical protein
LQPSAQVRTRAQNAELSCAQKARVCRRWRRLQALLQVNYACLVTFRLMQNMYVLAQLARSLCTLTEPMMPTLRTRLLAGTTPPAVQLASKLDAMQSL